MKEAEVKELNIMDEITNRLTGTIIHINPKGFGFLNSKEKPFTRIFFHWQALHHTIEFEKLVIGMKVSFELKKNEDGGWRAIRIELVNQ